MIVVKKHTDVGALTMNGVAGSLIAILDNLLVTGAGWTKEFSGVNTAVYRAPLGSNRQYLRVDDSAGTYAAMRGYTTMTGVDTGTNPFPTVAQMASGVFLPKSDAADATARQWYAVATARGFTIWTHRTSVSNDGSQGSQCYFGDINSFGEADSSGTILIGNTGTVSSNNNMTLQSASSSAGHYMAGSFWQATGSTPVGKMSDSVSATNRMGSSGYYFPNPIGTGMVLTGVTIVESMQVARGVLPGIWNPCHSSLISSVKSGDTFAGSGAHAGRQFILLGQYANSMTAVEISDTWDY